MKCMECGATLTDADFCTSCGADAAIYKKIIFTSNACYNDGLGKAKVRDLSGAAMSLRMSLKYNKENIPARNLLGLVYFAQGEVVSALAEWIISKNFQSEKNIANQYIDAVQSNQSKLNVLNQTIKKFNVALGYCQQGSEDLAVIQLKKILSVNPTLLKGQQLLALLYMKQGETAEAKKCLRKAVRIDSANTMTLRMMAETGSLNERADTEVGPKKKANKVAYQQGNETIIQPSSIRDNSGLMTVINIAIGIAIGIAVSWFLILPSQLKSQSGSVNEDVRKYSDQIAEKEAEISDLQKEVNSSQQKVDDAEAAKEEAIRGSDSNQQLINLFVTYSTGDYDAVEFVDTIMAIDENLLTEKGKTLLESMKAEVGTKACKTLYSSGYSAYKSGDYATAITDLLKVVTLDPDYNKGNAMYQLANSYEKSGDLAAATTYYQQVLEKYPNTQKGKDAKRFLDEQNTPAGDTGTAEE